MYRRQQKSGEPRAGEVRHHQGKSDFLNKVETSCWFVRCGLAHLGKFGSPNVLAWRAWLDRDEMADLQNIQHFNPARSLSYVHAKPHRDGERPML